MKYIIDVPDGTKWIEAYYTVDHFQYQGQAIIVDSLIPYTEPDLSPLVDEAVEAIEDEVWEFVKKIECLTIGETEDCFDVEYDGIPFIANMFSYQEAKARYEAWLKQKDEIHVGDEVKHRGRNYVVGYIGADKVYHLIDENWLRTVVQGGYQLIKTGRHFPEVAELLEKMRGEEQ